MPAVVNGDAEGMKQRGNELFAAKDYEGAIERFTEAMKLDGSQWTYPLNRCFAYLKLQRWVEAEADATATLKLDESSPKAWYRRSIARKALGKFSSARADIWSYGMCQGDWKTVVNENAKISAAEATFVVSTMNSSGRGFTIGSTGSHGHGAFAARRFVRGDLILVEKPLYTVKEHARPAEVAAAVNRLSADEREHLSELANAFEQLYDDPFWGIHKTNAFAAGEDDSILCLLASRFNHSCSPNARYSWHTQSRTFRIHSLREIAPGDELLVSYISGRHVYGSTAVQRQARLKAMLGFTCACVACTQPPTAQAASDARRTELTRLWDALPLFPPHRTPARLQAVRRALELMRAEDYDADADDFANEASAMCAFHADWASVRAWALCTYRARVAEFGGDSHRAIGGEVVLLLLEPHKYKMAGMGPPRVFSVRPP